MEPTGTLDKWLPKLRSSKPVMGKLALPDLLNAPDGVFSHEGRVLMITTNHMDVWIQRSYPAGRADKKSSFRSLTGRRSSSREAISPIRESRPKMMRQANGTHAKFPEGTGVGLGTMPLRGTTWRPDHGKRRVGPLISNFETSIFSLRSAGVLLKITTWSSKQSGLWSEWCAGGAMHCLI
ncbi:hypothetical protein F5Y19DRAFT_487368 [Xylariaceae sp. FL1651]|nr:hypothetical protein F5Y19DRAFT_487368 [Xylariaceae sp. FL1651]